ncbi:MAG TPA: glycosyltransferase family A protein [Thermoanaerobaculia bacterium]|jgi:glycosyltransferase involved in cell wall biosynthesis
MLKIVVNCGLCEDYIGPCLQSLQMQSWFHWQAIVTVDRVGDRTYERAIETAGGDPRIVVTRNRRRLYPMENILNAIRRSEAEAEDVIVILDGDDWFITDRALERIAFEHADEDCWMTYGSWISNSREHPGRWPAYRDGADFRTSPWLGTAVRTWKRWLFDLIADQDLRDRDGRYFRIGEDVACMFPMLEMATTRRARHIEEPLILYNRNSHHDPKRRLKNEGLRNVADLRARPRYAPLAGKVVHDTLSQLAS